MYTLNLHFKNNNNLLIFTIVVFKIFIYEHGNSSEHGR